VWAFGRGRDGFGRVGPGVRNVRRCAGSARESKRSATPSHIWSVIQPAVQDTRGDGIGTRISDAHRPGCAGGYPGRLHIRAAQVR
jgi:hypothetical protein